ncbi:hypothetical protein WJX72_003988 [[Myrmecia] bisecta]|uniref:Thioredoxin domain-containing protein n=1 Tax=[Myrmecia] bisecta TaxID=41462 RepID=A0AAW1QEV1_9CHLO
MVPRWGSFATINAALKGADLRTGNRLQQRRVAQREFAQALQKGKWCLLMFQSSRCGLCQSLHAPVEEIGEEHSSWLQVARVSADDDQLWAPEMLHYGVNHVPCLILLNPEGEALCKTGDPRSRQHMLASLHCLLRMATTGMPQQGHA